MNYKKLISVVGLVFVISYLSAQSQRNLPNLFRKQDYITPRVSNVADGIVTLKLNRQLLEQVYAEDNFDISMTVPVSKDEQVTLHLHKFNILAKDFILRTSSGDTIYNINHGLFYRGSIEGHEGFATISIFPGEVMGIISVKNVGNYNLGKLKNSDVDYVVYNDANFKGNRTFDCRTLEPPITRERTHSNAVQTREDNCIKFYIEGDYALYEDKGGTDGATQYIESLFAEMATLYDNEQISVEIQEIMVWDEPDGYSTTSSEDALNQFVNNNPDYNGDLASLYALGGQGTGGLAYVDVLCSDYGYAYMNISSTYEEVPTYSWSVEVITHEVGHNIGSRHTHACVWNGDNTQIDDCGSEAGHQEGDCYDPDNPIIPDAGTIMSYCHLLNGVGIDFNLGFGEQPGDLIRNRYNNANCLTECTGGASAPVADFEADYTEICENESVYFTDLSSNNPTAWSWTFEGGDPDYSDEQNPEVFYYNAGTYDVELEASNSVGSDIMLKEDYITVYPLAEPYFTYYIVNDNEVHFNNESVDADNYYWEFGDGEHSYEENPVHIYEEDGYFTVILYANNTECNEDQIYSADIQIVTPPQASMSISHSTGCKPDTIQFYDTSSENTESRKWLFQGGIPATSTQANPKIAYHNTGHFDVTLMVFNSLYSDTLYYQDTIYIHDKPHANFLYTINGNTVNFNNTTTDGNTYLWDFGDGNTSSDTNTVHTYGTGGDYNVNLIATNECGNDTVTKVIHITLEPVADFTADTTTGCVVFAAQFHSLANTQNISWVFEGGTPDTSTQINPLIHYNAPGSYDVTMYATNNLGRDTMVKPDYIQVLSQPIGDFTYSVSGYTASFTQSTASVDTFLWDFGDGNTITEVNPTHTYSEDGTYTVKFIYSNLCDTLEKIKEVVIANPPVAGFTFSPEGGCVPLTVQFTDQSSSNTQNYNWHFEGGTPENSNAKNPVVTYYNKGTFSVTLIASNSVGADTMVVDNAIHAQGPPTPAFTHTSDMLQYSFTYTGEEADLVKWKFGDGASATGFEVAHTYLSEGEYIVTVIAQNGCGSDTLQQTLQVATIPTANFTYDENKGCAPLTVHFTNTSSSSATSVEWNFEQGNPPVSFEQNPVVNYVHGGSFDVTLIAYGDNGNDTLVRENLIKVDAGPEVDFIYSINGATVSFESKYSDDAHTFFWDFGDGTVVSGVNVQHTYTASGNYKVTLYAKNDCGEQSASKTIAVTVDATMELDLQSITLAPNPNNGTFELLLNVNEEGDYGIKIYSIAGKILDKKTFGLNHGTNRLKFEYDFLPQGLYILEIIKNNRPYKLLFSVQ